MQYMNDPSLHMVRKEQRGLDVNDITGTKKTLHGPGSLPPTGPVERVAPVRPRVMEYDIINPTTGDNRLRMSHFGKNVLDSREKQRTQRLTKSPPAGKKMLAKMGEQNINEIWPQDEKERMMFNERGRGFETHDINLAKGNPRMNKLQMADKQRINMILAEKQRQQSQNTGRPYKNASNVFTHLVDDPTLRQKQVAKRNSSLVQTNPDDDLLSRMMIQDNAYGTAAAQDIAARQFDPVDLQRNGGMPLGAPSQVGNQAQMAMPRSKPDHMSVEAGQMRLFGINGSAVGGSFDESQKKRGGKRIIQLPQNDGANIFQ